MILAWVELTGDAEGATFVTAVVGGWITSAETEDVGARVEFIT